ncbi:ATP synthase subunit I [Thiofilum flexile]|uniref:ATP synthase subunit I n=1 Tax=Thiofilum flexile TaxID=125627 RepID=UPI00036FCB1F|nr:ATP synthase subunit I [Thiofilum flexile]
MNRLFSIQVVLVLLGIVIVWVTLGEASITATLYGGAVALANSALLSLRMNKKSEVASSDPHTTVILLYVSAVGRFLLVLVALSIGLGFLKLAPQPLLGMFIVAQLGYYIAALSARKQVEST